MQSATWQEIPVMCIKVILSGSGLQKWSGRTADVMALYEQLLLAAIGNQVLMSWGWV